jgi:hypothetical protein
VRKKFTPLLLIPIFLFACSKHESRPVTPPPPVADSTSGNAFLDPGNVTAIILTNTFRSFDLIHAYDSGGFVNITAKALINNDTCLFSINFADTLRTNIAYTNYTIIDTVHIGDDTFETPGGTENFNLGFYDDYLGTIYLSGVNKNFTGDTLVITTFDKARHLLAGTFKATMLTSTQESPVITQNSAYVTGSFNTYFNTPSK